MAPRFVEASSLTERHGPKTPPPAQRTTRAYASNRRAGLAQQVHARHHLAPATDKPPDQETDREASRGSGHRMVPRPGLRPFDGALCLIG